MLKTRAYLNRVVVISVFVAAILVMFADAPGAHAQALTGTYAITDAGFEIALPDSWSGRQVDRTRAVFSPSNSQDVSMTVVTVDRVDTKRLLTQEIDASSLAASAGCRSSEGGIISLNDVKVFHTVRECSGPESYGKTETYVFFTLAKAVAVSLSAGSAEAFDRHVAAFSGSVQAAKVKSPVDFRSSLEVIFGTTGILKTDIDVEAIDSQVGLVTATSSRVASVAFDEESKRIVVLVNELRRPEGNLLVPVDGLLRGPYQVYVNGSPHDNFLVITDEETGEELVNVWYDQGISRIEIVGAEVVPEFGTVVAGVLAAALSAAAFQRFRKQSG